MIRVLTIFFLDNSDQRLGRWVYVFGSEPEFNELNVVVEPNNPSVGYRLYVLLCDITRLVIEETVRVPAPSNAAHIDSKQNLARGVTYSY